MNQKKAEVNWQWFNLKAIQEILGHSGILTTADIYSHVSKELKRKAMKSTEFYFGHQSGTK